MKEGDANGEHDERKNQECARTTIVSNRNLMLAVSELTGGWGFICRFDNIDGIH